MTVSTLDGKRSIAVQVKTATSAFRKRAVEADSFWEWPINLKLADLSQRGPMFIFVDLCLWPAEDASGKAWWPEVQVVPSADVARKAKEAKRWVSSRPSFRISWKESNRYWERWDRIERSLRSLIV